MDVSRQLRDYVNGTPAEMVSLSSPNILFVRTESIPQIHWRVPALLGPPASTCTSYLDDEHRPAP
jgi:hypothetical protein